MEKAINILLIEDNLNYAQMIMSILTKKAPVLMNVEHRKTFSEGLESVLAGNADIVLLDLDLPDSSTTDTLQKIKDASVVPIIVLTGTDDESIAIQAVRMGAQDYLMKGQMNSSILIRSIRYAIERKKIDDQLRAAEERFRLLIENALDLIAILDVDGTVRYVSPSHKRILGYESEELIGKKAFEFIHPDDLSRVLDVFTTGLFDPGKSLAAEYRFKHREGHWVMLESFGKTFPPESSESGVVINSRDITERKKMEESLRNLSITDDLTGLNNRRGFLTLADQQIKLSERNNQQFSLILIDVDELKLINDEFGHMEGDSVLVSVADIIRDTFRQSDVIARVSGDEFLVLTADSSLSGSEVVRVRLEKNIGQYNAKNDKQYNLSVSFGVAVYDPQNPCSIDRLLAKADELMYADKRRKSINETAKFVSISSTSD